MSMNPERNATHAVPPRGPPRRAGPGLPAGFLRLVKSAPERAAIATGQVDAVIDPASGNVFLLPGAQQALLERQARAAGLLGLAADWTWEQDENFCFTAQAGTAAWERAPCEALVIGKPLWEIGLATRPGLDWRTHRQQLEWRATFRDLELGWTNAAGEQRWYSLDGGAVFDAQDRFQGYRGTARDVTHRERLRAALQAERTHGAVRQHDEARDGPDLADRPDRAVRADPWPRPRPGGAPGDLTANALLAALPDEERQLLAADLTPVTLQAGDVLCVPGERLRYAYFPTAGLVSLRTSVRDGLSLETGLVGPEGMVGASLVLGTDVATVRAVVLRSGGALRMTAARLRRALRESLPLQAEACRVVHAKLVLARQTAACARFHVLEARLAGWLLGARERLGGNELHFTHDTLATVLGVRRVGITCAASDLERRALISYQRGVIRVLDPKGLEAAACGCHARAGERPLAGTALAPASDQRSGA